LITEACDDIFAYNNLFKLLQNKYVCMNITNAMIIKDLRSFCILNILKYNFYCSRENSKEKLPQNLLLM